MDSIASDNQVLRAFSFVPFLIVALGSVPGHTVPKKRFIVTVLFIVFLFLICAWFSDENLGKKFK